MHISFASTFSQGPRPSLLHTSQLTSWQGSHEVFVANRPAVHERHAVPPVSGIRPKGHGEQPVPFVIEPGAQAGMGDLVGDLVGLAGGVAHILIHFTSTCTGRVRFTLPQTHSHGDRSRSDIKRGRERERVTVSKIVAQSDAASPTSIEIQMVVFTIPVYMQFICSGVLRRSTRGIIEKLHVQCHKKLSQGLYQAGVESPTPVVIPNLHPTACT